MSTQVFYVDTRRGAPRLRSYTISLVAAVRWRVACVELLLVLEVLSRRWRVAGVEARRRRDMTRNQHAIAASPHSHTRRAAGSGPWRSAG